MAIRVTINYKTTHNRDINHIFVALKKHHILDIRVNWNDFRMESIGLFKSLTPTMWLVAGNILNKNCIWL